MSEGMVLLGEVVEEVELQQAEEVMELNFALLALMDQRVGMLLAGSAFCPPLHVLLSPGDLQS